MDSFTERKEITSLEELVTTFSRYCNGEYVFRGLTDKNQLLPKLIRGEDFSGSEIEALRRFEELYGMYASANTCWEFLALAQHFGLVTRYIDFSTNPYVALFFALHDEVSEWTPRMIVVLKTEHTVSMAAIPKPDEDRPIDEKWRFSTELSHIFDRMQNKNRIYLVPPNFKSNRMFVQQGLFLMPSKLEKRFIIDSFTKEAEVFEIAPEIRGEVQEYLRVLGFDEHHLFPDLERACREINLRILQGNQ